MRLLPFALAAGLAVPAAHAQSLDARLADLRLATAVRLALAADPNTSHIEAAVRARGGAVALGAEWPSADVQARAATIARGVQGVSDVSFGEAPPDTPDFDPNAEVDAEDAETVPTPAPEPIRPEPRPAETPRAAPATREPAAPAPVRAEPIRPTPPPTPEPAPPSGGWNTPAPRTEPAPAADGATYHTVLLGDTLFSIARRYRTTVEALQGLNRLNGTEIALGQRLRVR